MRGRERALRVAIRLAVFVVLSLAGLNLSGTALYWLTGNLLLTSALAVFLAATVANAVLMRIYEGAPLVEVGFAWTGAGRRNLLLGLVAGMGAALVLVAGAVASPAAEWEAIGAETAGWPSVLFVVVLLALGAAGEEMLFHGYGFQVLMATLGPWGAILPVSLLFALAHTGNLNVNALGLANTFGWGLLLGYAFWRSGDLWLPIGLHAGWNWALPLAGIPLSGFTMNLTGYAVRWKAGPLWSGGEYGLEGSILTSAILLVLFPVLRSLPIERQPAFLLAARGEARC
ncbi:MAG: type II CAAX endopeptidase family protein [Bryobacterales bacterium]|nr:CPBP family intramembrane metalloprotease [Bryobacteraceae bacterium]MDW8129057.1 type II CAAX endopeptidase family protein [Bryobacterales bacterium]